MMILVSAAIAHADGYRLRDHVAQVPPAAGPKVIRCMFPSQIQPYIVRERSRVERCVELTRRRDWQLPGTVTAKFFVDNDGHVQDSTAEGVAPDLDRCVARAMLSARFPRGMGGVTVMYPWRVIADR